MTPRAGRTICLTPGILGVALILPTAGLADRIPAGPQPGNAAACQASGTLVALPGLREASGLAVSRRVPGRLWAHNDSGQPVVFSLDDRGRVTGRLRVTGAVVKDWEAIAVGPCANGSCLYIGDIGDNKGARSSITVYRLPEPSADGGSVNVEETFHATYPDRAQDAESLLVAGDGRIYIVTKGDAGPVALYRFPTPLQSGATARLERVAIQPGQPDADSRITDADVSPDGRWALLRTRNRVTFYRASELFAGQWRPAARVDLAALKEPQGEGVAIGADSTLFVAGESGGKAKTGTFARFSCAPKE